MSIRRTYIKTKKNLFNKLNSFGIENTNEQTLSKNIAVFDFESTCVQGKSFKDTDTTKRIGKHVPISVCFSPNLIEEPIFLCNSDPHHLVPSRIGAFEILALHNEAVTKKLFFDIGTTIKNKLGSLLEKPTQGHNRGEQTNLNDCDNETFTSTQF